MATMTTAFWHPFADMAAVSRREMTIERGEGVWVYDSDDNRSRGAETRISVALPRCSASRE